MLLDFAAWIEVEMDIQNMIKFKHTTRLKSKLKTLINCKQTNKKFTNIKHRLIQKQVYQNQKKVSQLFCSQSIMSNKLSIVSNSYEQ